MSARLDEWLGTQGAIPVTDDLTTGFGPDAVTVAS